MAEACCAAPQEAYRLPGTRWLDHEKGRFQRANWPCLSSGSHLELVLLFGVRHELGPEPRQP
jgi:hypothetical protein